MCLVLLLLDRLLLFSSLTALWLSWYTTWLGIISQIHYRDLNSVNSATSFLVSTRMTFQSTTHLEELCLKNENYNWRKRKNNPRRLPESQATRATKECAGRSLLKDGLLTDYQWKPSAHYGVCRKKCFISDVHISHVKSLASIDTSVWTLKTFPGMLLFKCREIECISEMSSRVLWHFMKRSYKCKEHPFMGKYSLVERRMVIPYDTIEGKNVVTGNLSCLSLFLFLEI